jgi:ABC-2 type transport system ATP-binding protein
METVTLSVENLTKTYAAGFKTVDGLKAVDGLTLSLAPGELCALTGRNGAGKTTTLRCIAGILHFEAGRISVAGRDLVKESVAAKRSLAYIPDEPQIYEFLTGVQYLRFIASVYGLDAERGTELARDCAGAFNIESRLGDPVKAWSRGMKQKLALVGALMREPRLLLLDEPFTGLDPEAVVLLKDILQKFCNTGGTVFFSTHDLARAEELCSRTIVIDKGRLAGDRA